MTLYNKINILDADLESIYNVVLYKNRLDLLYRYDYYIIYLALDLEKYVVIRCVKFKTYGRCYMLNNNIYIHHEKSIILRYNINDNWNNSVTLYNKSNIDTLKEYDYGGIIIRSGHFYAFEIKSELHFLTIGNSDEKKFQIINAKNRTVDTYNINDTNLSLFHFATFVNNTLYMVSNCVVVIYDITSNEMKKINVEKVIPQLYGPTRILAVSDTAVTYENYDNIHSIYDFKSNKLLEFNCLFGDIIKKEDIYNLFIVNENHIVYRNNLYVILNNTINKFDDDDTIILKSTISPTFNQGSIPKNILIKRCKLFSDIDSIYDLKENIFESEKYEYIHDYIEFITTGNIKRKNSLELFDLCLYLQDIDVEYVASYIINNYIFKDIHTYLNKLYYSQCSKQFYILLNNYLSCLSLEEYDRFIDTCDTKMYKSILKYFSRRYAQADRLKYCGYF